MIVSTELAISGRAATGVVGRAGDEGEGAGAEGEEVGVEAEEAPASAEDAGGARTLLKLPKDVGGVVRIIGKRNDMFGDPGGVCDGVTIGDVLRGGAAGAVEATGDIRDVRDVSVVPEGAVETRGASDEWGKGIGGLSSRP